MTLIVSRISVAQAATIINAAITFVQFTLSLSLVILLVYLLPKSTSALSWSSISRTLHSSFWPTILRADSSSNRGAGTTVSTISRLSLLSTILIAVAGVTLPLGLHDGPLVPSQHREVPAKYLTDTSALASATTPQRSRFMYGRQCGSFSAVPCPGNGDNQNDTSIAPSTMEIFNSTPHGPFSMQFRRFFDANDYTQNLSIGILGTSESFILRDDLFAGDGMIVDMNSSHPGVGLWNQSVPTIVEGGTWSQDVLWLEPVTKCVDTNVSVDYFLMNGPQRSVETFNLTDHGGFMNLTRTPPTLNRDGQHINLVEHAYKGGAYSNLYAMLFLNATRESSFEGKAYPINSTLGAGLNGLDLGKTGYLKTSYLNTSATADTNVICVGFGGLDNVNVTNAHVSCGLFLGPPLRTDGGDPRLFERGSRWTQAIHSCSSATRAKIQTVTFSTNSTSSLHDIKVSRDPANNTVLWAMEKTNMTIADLDPFWGRVDDKYENNPNLWTLRNDYFYLPAGSASIFSVLASGNPSAAHTAVWGSMYDSLPSSSLMDYSGETDYAIKAKFQDLVAKSGTEGQAQIRNLIWTDIMANTLIGGQSNPTLLVASFHKTIEYDFKYAIPGFLLLIIWAPSFLGALLLLITRVLTFERMRKVFNHTSVGRVVVGTSALRVVGPRSATGGMTMPEPMVGVPNASFVDVRGSTQGHRRGKSDWANTTGKTQVSLDWNTAEPDTEDMKLMSSY